ncbi:hypothetical protein BC832DRAFT_27953 [Gaertneriomyces semiglobifer]|nr:hypothetical protein BC832DRAFT_27953 [Gaertneriomyces semiglobifer]
MSSAPSLVHYLPQLPPLLYFVLGSVARAAPAPTIRKATCSRTNVTTTNINRRLRIAPGSGAACQEREEMLGRDTGSGHTFGKPKSRKTHSPDRRSHANSRADLKILQSLLRTDNIHSALSLLHELRISELKKCDRNTIAMAIKIYAYAGRIHDLMDILQQARKSRVRVGVDGVIKVLVDRYVTKPSGMRRVVGNNNEKEDLELFLDHLSSKRYKLGRLGVVALLQYLIHHDTHQSFSRVATILNLSFPGLHLSLPRSPSDINLPIMELLDRIRKFTTIELGPYEYTCIITSAFSRGQAPLAKRVCELALSCDKVDVVLFSAMMRGYANFPLSNNEELSPFASTDSISCEAYDNCRALLNLMHAHKVQANAHVYTILLSTCRTLSQAEAYWAQMEKDGIKFDAVALSAYMNIHARHGDFTSCLRLTKMSVVDPRTAVRFLLKACVNSATPEVEKVRFVEELVRREGVAIEYVGWWLVKGYCSCDAIGDVERIYQQLISLWRERRRNGQGSKPMNGTEVGEEAGIQEVYHTLMAYYAEKGDVQRVEKVFEDMLVDSGAPERQRAPSNVSACQPLSNIPMEQITKLPTSELVNTQTINILIHAHARASQYDRVQTLYTLLKERHLFSMNSSTTLSPITSRQYTVTPMTVMHVFDAIGRLGTHDDLTAVLHDSHLLQISFTENTYNSLLEALGRFKEFQKMESVLYNMLANGIRPTMKTFWTVIQPMTRAGWNVSSALRVFEREEAVPPEWHSEMEMRKHP